MEKYEVKKNGRFEENPVSVTFKCEHMWKNAKKVIEARGIKSSKGYSRGEGRIEGGLDLLIWAAEAGYPALFEPCRYWDYKKVPDYKLSLQAVRRIALNAMYKHWEIEEKRADPAWDGWDGVDQELQGNESYVFAFLEEQRKLKSNLENAQKFLDEAYIMIEKGCVREKDMKQEIGELNNDLRDLREEYEAQKQDQ